MKCDTVATVGQGGQRWLVCEAGQFVAAELVGPVVLGARNVADLQTDVAGRKCEGVVESLLQPPLLQYYRCQRASRRFGAGHH